MSELRLTVGSVVFTGHFEETLAPKTCAAFRKHLPFKTKFIHVRWSGEGVWSPLDAFDFGVGFENNTCYPAAGQIILYPGGASETELLLAYGHVNFASKAGQLSGNHFITLTSGLEQLAQLGKRILWEGAEDVVFDLGQPPTAKKRRG